MKKTYIIPEALTVVLGSTQMMAASEPDVIVDDSETTTIDADKVEVKGISDTKLWDDLW